ncbi:MAG: TlpA family protein disulfide reductase [Verrucomicrobiaceae bacterium]|nr:MAG: TlpA family protein disulfide reductase [Verrucomicrobiaceae bacterium]
MDGVALQNILLRPILINFNNVMKFKPALLLALLLPLTAQAEDKVTLSQFQLGKTLSGTPVTQESLKGKPVVMEFWGVNCGPCLAHMPMFNTLAKRYDSKGLVVIGAHAQQATDEEILEKVKSTKVKFPVLQNANGPVSFSGIPHSFIFGADGTMLFHGHPDDKDFEKFLRQAVKEAPAPTATTSTSTLPGAAAGKGKSTSTLGNGPIVPERTWTNAEGKPVAAALMSVTNGQGKFRRKDGTVFNYAVNKLSSTDQEIITTALDPKAAKDSDSN